MLVSEVVGSEGQLTAEISVAPETQEAPQAAAEDFETMLVDELGGSAESSPQEEE